MTTETAPAPSPTPLLSDGWQQINAVGLLGVIAGLVSAAAGRLWTVPVAMCGGSYGRAGTDFGWWLCAAAGLAALVMAATTLVVAIGAIAGRRDWWRHAALCLGWAVACATTAILGLVSNFGDTPLFCF